MKNLLTAYLRGSMGNKTANKNKRAILVIVATYTLVGTLWIYFSEESLRWFISDRAAIIRLDIIKGTLFIFLTAYLLYVLISRYARQLLVSEGGRIANEERLELALSASKMGVWECDLRTNAIYWSPECFEILGLENLNHSLDSFTNALHPDDASRVMAAYTQALSKQIEYADEFRVILSNGDLRWILNCGQGKYDKEGKPLKLVGTVQDITERKKMEIALKEANELLEYRVRERTEELEQVNLTLLNEIQERKRVELEIIHYRGHLEELVRERTTALEARNKQLDAEIEQRKQAESALRNYAQRIIVLEEKMRRNIASELHDEIGRDLTALGLNFSIISNALSKDSREKLGSRVDDSICLIEDMGRNVRSMMTRLRPPVLDDYGLVSALRSHADQFAKRTGIAVDVQLEVIVPRLSDEIETTLFRIAQEALANVAKHAEASFVTLSLIGGDGRVRLSIEDDGQGFDPDLDRPKGPEAGWGLTIMRERAESVEACFSIASKPGQGTVVAVETGKDS
ncbi:MAG: hypothetical protein CXR30_15105 [Geobacter sp.]|nr:MAG: hypothetical protein CXR30_15105 [Geobacter sp.]